MYVFYVTININVVVGLSFTTQEDSLRQAFSPHGDIHEGKLLTSI
jgi:hypothetical protein